MDKKNEECGYAGYLDQYVKYPPSGPLPLPGGSFRITDYCDIWWDIFQAALIINPAFNVYRIFDVVCPSGLDSLLDALNGLPSTPFPGTSLASRKIPCCHCLGHRNDLKHRHGDTVPNQQTLPVYFDRADVKAAIHAPNVPWQECAAVDVFPEGDASRPTALSVLPSVIERSNRTVIIHGLADFILIAEGTRIVIQKSVIPPYNYLISSDRIYAA